MLTFLIVVSGASLVRAAAAPVEKVNASYGAISGSMMPIWVTEEAKLFEKQGLELNLVYISGGPRAIMRYRRQRAVRQSLACPRWKPTSAAPTRR
jgi:ABC-type nitrate/sulfonate/bicarbonate transport system substrate-binding protein